MNQLVREANLHQMVPGTTTAKRPAKINQKKEEDQPNFVISVRSVTRSLARLAVYMTTTPRVICLLKNSYICQKTRTDIMLALLTAVLYGLITKRRDSESIFTMKVLTQCQNSWSTEYRPGSIGNPPSKQPKKYSIGFLVKNWSQFRALI